MAAPTQPISGEHLITIYDRGQEQTIVTKSSTVHAALDEAHVATSQGDVVEPGLDEPLTAKQYNINIYRARPVVVDDGLHKVRVLTAAQSPAQIAKAASVPLYDEDHTKIERVDDVLADGGAGLKMTIDRATTFTFTLYGKSFTARTQATTVGELLKEKGIVIGVNDGVSLPDNAAITEGMVVSVWRNGVQTFTQEEVVTMPVRQVKDTEQPIGYKQVQTPGKDGKKQVTYQINMQNGVEVSRTVIQEVVTDQPTEQVEVIGTKVALPAGSHEDWMAAAGIASSDFGYVNYIVNHENGAWEPCKVQGGAIDCNYSGSMGYGLVQATPGGKMVSAGADWRTNPITQLKWASGYAVSRYGSWSAAYNHWLASHNW